MITEIVKEALGFGTKKPVKDIENEDFFFEGRINALDLNKSKSLCMSSEAAFSSQFTLEYAAWLSKVWRNAYILDVGMFNPKYLSILADMSKELILYIDKDYNHQASPGYGFSVKHLCNDIGLSYPMVDVEKEMERVKTALNEASTHSMAQAITGVLFMMLNNCHSFDLDVIKNVFTSERMIELWPISQLGIGAVSDVSYFFDRENKPKTKVLKLENYTFSFDDELRIKFHTLSGIVVFTKTQTRNLLRIVDGKSSRVFYKEGYSFCRGQIFLEEKEGLAFLYSRSMWDHELCMVFKIEEITGLVKFLQDILKDPVWSEALLKRDQMLGDN